MNELQIQRLMGYLDGSLSSEEKHRLEEDLDASPELRKELDALKALDGMIRDIPAEEPSAKLDRELAYLLTTEEKRTRSGRPWLLFSPLGVAAAVALLIIGSAFGVLWQRNQVQQEQIDLLVGEVQDTRKMMILAMLDERSPSGRIKALQTVRKQPVGPDSQIMEALLNTLNTDDNVNVRIKAAEALGTFGNHPGLDKTLAASLRVQGHPEVQITLIEILIQLQAQDAVDDLRKVMDDEQTHEAVKNKAAYGIQQLL